MSQRSVFCPIRASNSPLDADKLVGKHDFLLMTFKDLGVIVSTSSRSYIMDLLLLYLKIILKE